MKLVGFKYAILIEHDFKKGSYGSLTQYELSDENLTSFLQFLYYESYVLDFLTNTDRCFILIVPNTN